jgi:peptide/nickel transport system ATP-binding protein
MVMYMGKICEVAGSDDLFARPTHPYTRALMAAIPGSTTVVDDSVLDGELPSAIDPPPGCRFHTRCPLATDECRSVEPELRSVGDGHYVACHHPVLGGD